MESYTPSLPPFQWWDSQEDLLLDLQIYAAIEGYRFIIRRSKWESGRQSIVYACSRWRTGCQFSILIKEKHYGNWVYEYRSEDRFLQHNHELQSTRQPESKPQDTLEGERQGDSESISQDEPENGPPDKLEKLVQRTQPTCSKCHSQGHKRGAKSCPLRGRSSPMTEGNFQQVLRKFTAGSVD